MKPIGYDDLRDEEVRVTDGWTGGQKGSKITQLGALDPVALLYLARVAGYGANKYAPFNFLRGYNWSLSQNAGARHSLQFWAGEDIDPESGLPHPAMEAWHALTKLSFLLRGIGTDDRPPKLAVEGALKPEIERAERLNVRCVHSLSDGLVCGKRWSAPIHFGRASLDSPFLEPHEFIPEFPKENE